MARRSTTKRDAALSELVTLPNGEIVKPFSVKCDIPGCTRRKSGYLTIHRSNLGGGAFYDRRGNLLCDLRDRFFVCRRHGIVDGSAPFLIRDEDE